MADPELSNEEIDSLLNDLEEPVTDPQASSTPPTPSETPDAPSTTAAWDDDFNQEKDVSLDLDSLEDLGSNISKKSSVKKINFGELSSENEGSNNTNMKMLLDVPMDITVELGRTVRKVKDILALNVGAVIELNKLSGEPVELLVNGKVIALAEVVVIDENFGVRITEIIEPEKRVKFE